MGGDRGLGRLGRKHVRLQQNPVAGADEGLHTAVGRQKANDRGLYRAAFIVVNTFDGNEMHRYPPCVEAETLASKIVVKSPAIG